jgi:hypothetical protein
MGLLLRALSPAALDNSSGILRNIGAISTHTRPKASPIAFTVSGSNGALWFNAFGEYLVLSVAPETFARLAPGIATERLPQFTDVADALFAPLVAGLSRAGSARQHHRWR